MKYIEFKTYANRAGIEMLTDLYLANGIDSVSVDDPADIEVILNKKNEYDWDYIDDEVKYRDDVVPTITIYFDDVEESRETIQNLQVQIEQLKRACEDGLYGEDADFGELRSEFKVVDDEDWKYKWKEFFKPTKVTDRIVVKPTWEEYEAQGDEVILEIDPGMAFGTGTHETTSLCMKLLEKYQAKVDNQAKVLDVGCGSGILAISSALLGCKDILGIEIDKDAVEVAKENVELNYVSDAVKVIEGDLVAGIDYKADIVVANLMADLVMILAGSVRKHMNPNGVFISSGILTDKEKIVSEAIKAAGFEIIEILEDGEWCAIAARV